MHHCLKGLQQVTEYSVYKKVLALVIHQVDILWIFENYDLIFFNNCEHIWHF